MEQSRNLAKLHNIPTREGRDQAERELVRMLKPGGRIALYDLRNQKYGDSIPITPFLRVSAVRNFFCNWRAVAEF